LELRPSSRLTERTAELGTCLPSCLKWGTSWNNGVVFGCLYAISRSIQHFSLRQRALRPLPESLRISETIDHASLARCTLFLDRAQTHGLASRTHRRHLDADMAQLGEQRQAAAFEAR
jgi:hypothetical protein